MAPGKVEETSRENHEVGAFNTLGVEPPMVGFFRGRVMPLGVEPLMADFLRGRVWTKAAPGRGHGMAPPPKQSQVQDQPEIQKNKHKAGEIHLWRPQGGGRELIPTSCPWISMCFLGSDLPTCAYAKTLTRVCAHT